jgi:tripartite-type tricarboxylate transporter receptor subunit TctC
MKAATTSSNKADIRDRTHSVQSAGRPAPPIDTLEETPGMTATGFRQKTHPVRTHAEAAPATASPLRRHLMLGTALAVALACAAAPWQASHAQGVGDYPNRMMRIISPHTPGGLGDTFARYLALELGKRLNQPVVVENRAGANQAIAAEAAARAAPDGYTLFIGTQTALVFNPIAKKKLPYDAVKDFAPVSMLFNTPFYLVVNSNVPATTVPELISLAKAKPGKLTFASLGQGSSQHLVAEMFKDMAKVDILHIPYKGSAPASTDLMAGQVDMMFEGGSSSLPNVATGKLRALASTSLKRTEAMPNLPTVAETLPGFELTVWFGLVAPAGVPRPIIDKLNREVTAILKEKATHDKFYAVGVEVSPSTPEELSQRIQAEIPQWTKVMRDANIQAE